MYKFLIAEHNNEYGTTLDSRILHFDSWQSAENYCRESHQAVSTYYVKGGYANSEFFTSRSLFESAVKQRG